MDTVESTKGPSNALASLATEYAEDDDPSSPNMDHTEKDNITDEEEDFIPKQDDMAQEPAPTTNIDTVEPTISTTATVLEDKEKSNDDEPVSVPPIITSAQNSIVDPENVVQFSGEPYQTHRDNASSDSDSDNEFSPTYDSDSESDGSEPKIVGTEKGNKMKKIKQPPRVKGELSVSDLPPIEDLQISVPHEKVQAVGVIKSFVDPLVIVEGYPDSPALNLDSVLFIEQGDRALGHIFDVFGPVKQPHYCVRFNSKDHVDQRGIKVGMTVYCAPATPHSKFVFLAQLEKMKGSDASWLDDLEPPPEAAEFSDDEKERFAKKGRSRRKGKQRPIDQSIPPKPDEDSQRNANSSRKRNFNYTENQGHFPRHPNPHFIPPHVPGFMPGPPPFPHPNHYLQQQYLHRHYYDNNRGGARRMHFRPHFDDGGFNGGGGIRHHNSGHWTHFEQPTKHYWRPPPIIGKPQWAPFPVHDAVPFETPK